jgi:hypothetical protein
VPSQSSEKLSGIMLLDLACSSPDTLGTRGRADGGAAPSAWHPPCSDSDDEKASYSADGDELSSGRETGVDGAGLLDDERDERRWLCVPDDEAWPGRPIMSLKCR